MAEHIQLGKQGEDIAVEYLIQKGYYILDRNWRTGRYELDIVARLADVLVVVEVKTRQRRYQQTPDEAINYRKMLHLVRASDRYVRMHGYKLKVRIDIIMVVIDNDGRATVDHLEDAIYPPVS